jgi:hypothetical protein
MSDPASDTTAISGPWIADATVCTEEGGLAVIAVNPDVPVGGTPTRGMVAWVNNRCGACDTDDKAIATARLIAAAPDLLAALEAVVSVADRKTVEFDQAHAAIAKAKGVQNVR